MRYKVLGGIVALMLAVIGFQVIDHRTSATVESCAPTMSAVLGGEEKIVCVTQYTSQITGRSYWDYDNVRIIKKE